MAYKFIGFFFFEDVAIDGLSFKPFVSPNRQTIEKLDSS